MSAVALLNQTALILGFIGSIVLAFSNKVGVISKDGSVIFSGMDPMESAAKNLSLVEKSHRRSRVFTPIGWVLISLSFLLQFVATFL